MILRTLAAASFALVALVYSSSGARAQSPDPQGKWNVDKLVGAAMTETDLTICFKSVVDRGSMDRCASELKAAKADGMTDTDVIAKWKAMQPSYESRTIDELIRLAGQAADADTRALSARLLTLDEDLKKILTQI